MNNSFDIIVPKDYVTKKDGVEEKKTAWNKIGRAWLSRSGDAMNFELYLFPNQKYVIQLSPKNKPVPKTDDSAPF